MPHRKLQSASTDKASAPAGKAVASPCCKKCNLLPDNTCGGCGRNLMEIAMWGSMTDEQRLAVWGRIGQKRKD
jgi:predicted Fe-S protein YdhL (DUF1289 family)